MSKDDLIDESSARDYEKAKEIASRCSSFEEISALMSQLLTEALMAGEQANRALYWAMMYYGCVNNDRAAYLMIRQQKPEMAKQFDAVVKAQTKANATPSEEAPAKYPTTREETAYCFKTAFEIGRASESEKDIFAAIPQGDPEVIKLKIRFWASLYLSLTKNKAELYNSIKADFSELVSEFEYWCEHLLIEQEQSESAANRFSLAELKEIGFDIDTEAVETIREFRRLLYGRNLKTH
jgi:hypothetical protein